MSDSNSMAPGGEKQARRRAVVLLGAPGAGKGTQAMSIAAFLAVPHLSTGDMFRDHLARGDELGRQARAIVEAGNLVPDELVNAMVADRLQKSDCAKGFVLDGYPRTVAQAQALNTMLGEGEQGPVVINLRVDYNKLIQRLTGRRSCPQCGKIYNVFLQPPAREGICDSDGAALIHRKDDQEDVIRERMAAYEASTKPLVEHYRERPGFFEVDGNQPPASITEALRRILETAGSSLRRAEG